MPVIDADNAEAGPLVQREARLVLREDSRDQLPKALLLAGVKEALEGGATGPGPAGAALDVDRMLAGSGIAGIIGYLILRFTGRSSTASLS